MECDGRFLIVSLEALWDEKLQIWPNVHFCPVMIQCEQFWTILAIFKIISSFSRLHHMNGVLYFCSDENRKAKNEFTGVQHLIVWIGLFGINANSSAIPQACTHTHTCTWVTTKIDSAKHIRIYHDSILLFTSSICAGYADYRCWGCSTCTNTIISV